MIGELWRAPDGGIESEKEDDLDEDGGLEIADDDSDDERTTINDTFRWLKLDENLGDVRRERRKCALVDVLLRKVCTARGSSADGAVDNSDVEDESSER